MRVRASWELQNHFLIETKIWFAEPLSTFSKVQILTKTKANSWEMLYYSMAVMEVQQFSANLFIQSLSPQWLFQSDH